MKFLTGGNNQMKLKICPFCNSSDITIRNKVHQDRPVVLNGAKYAFVLCMDCDARTADCFESDAKLEGFTDHIEMAVFNWNMRKGNSIKESEIK